MSITIALGVIVMLLLFSSCSGRKKEMAELSLPNVIRCRLWILKGVTTLISDSGITTLSGQYGGMVDLTTVRNHLIGLLRKVYIWKNSILYFILEASIKADTAYYYNQNEFGS